MWIRVGLDSAEIHFVSSLQNLRYFCLKLFPIYDNLYQIEN